MEIDLSQVESTANFMGPAIVETGLTGVEPPQIGNRSRMHAPHNIFRASGDDKWVAVAVLNDAQWQALCVAMDRVDLASEARYSGASGRLADVAAVEQAVAQWLLHRSADSAVEALRNAEVPVSKVQSSRDLIENDAQLRANGSWQRVDHPEIGSILLNSPPFKIDGERVELERPPLLGEHTREVLAAFLKVSPTRLAELDAAGALS
jgi:benzylsuccinate CoA-transferase BbsF subunit